MGTAKEVLGGAAKVAAKGINGKWSKKVVELIRSMN